MKMKMTFKNKHLYINGHVNRYSCRAYNWRNRNENWQFDKQQKHT